ncbi:DUF1559 domain-containing protein [bacterium]|nr:MAG: DUF1559 domain-containing protein [bacterium]
MTPILKKQLTILSGAAVLFGALVWNVGPLNAQAQGGVAGDISGGLFSVFFRARENAFRARCQSNLKQISLGFLMYSQDYDEKLPPAKPWIDVLQPYIKSEEIFKCPSFTTPKNNFGYAYNSKLSGKEEKAVSDFSRTVSFYETIVLKRNAYFQGENRAARHLDGANYAFADGHIKWFKKDSTFPSFKLKN